MKKWYREKTVAEVVEEDKRRQFKEFVVNEARKIANVGCGWVDRVVNSFNDVAECNGYIYICWKGSGGQPVTSGVLRVTKDDFWNKDPKDMQIEDVEHDFWLDRKGVTTVLRVPA